MFVGSYRVARSVVLGLMFFLAVTAPCSSSSYDPDPYDDVPPVVTVEFNYVVPSAVNVRQSNVPGGSWHNAALLEASLISAAPPALAENGPAPDLIQGSPVLVVPLRR
jgi:hypothetical protein